MLANLHRLEPVYARFRAAEYTGETERKLAPAV